MIMNWYWRVARRFLVVAACGAGLAAINLAAHILPTLTASDSVYAGVAMGMLAAAEKFIRDHNDEQTVIISPKK